MKQQHQNASNKQYKVCTNDKYGPREERKTARLQVSMGIEKHTGTKFASLCDWTERRFDSATIIVSDSLQRHNIAFLENISTEEASLKAQEIGDQWLRNNQTALSKLSDAKVTRWNDWLNHPEFTKNIDEIYSRYEHDSEFRDALNCRVQNIWERRAKKDPVTYSEDRKTSFFHHSLTYMLEELAIFPIMFEDTAIDVYAGSWFSDLFEILKKDLHFALTNALNKAVCYEVDFVRAKKQPSLQVA